jgi:tetratricopeptide (TPR) repeat protein
MQAGLEAAIARGDWENAAQCAGNFSELTLELGDVPRAVVFGEQSVELADRIGSTPCRINERTVRADALHQAGRWKESMAGFREAEGMQVERQPAYPRLYSLWNFRYCELMLGQVEPEAGSGLDGFAEPSPHPEKTKQFRLTCRKVLKRVRQTQEWFERRYAHIDFALDHILLGRAQLGLALTVPGEDRTAAFAHVAELLDRAVDCLRRAAHEDDLPRGLLARAILRRFQSNFPGATADLTEALEIAERGPMRLHECDAHLEWARLCRDQGDLAAARLHVARARVLVNETGYGRREREVRWLEGALVP